MNNFLKSALMLLVICVQSPMYPKNWDIVDRIAYIEDLKSVANGYLFLVKTKIGMREGMRLQYKVESIIDFAESDKVHYRKDYMFDRYGKIHDLQSFIAYVEAVHSHLFESASSAQVPVHAGVSTVSNVLPKE